MIRFLLARGSEYVVERLIRGRMYAGEISPPCAVLTYDRLFARRSVPAGVYIFADLERLTPWELRAAAEAYGVIAAAPHCRALNNPARVMTRYELLRRLHLEGINDFDAIRADEWRSPSRYPVFLRTEQDHGRPLSGLIESPEALEQALRKLRDGGIPARGVLIVEYAAEPVAPGIFRKLSTFRVGGGVFAHHIVTEDSWIVKHGSAEENYRDQYQDFEWGFVSGNLYADVLTRAFEIAGVEYGRADFGLVGGRVQLYEINTNPYLGDDPRSEEAVRQRTIRFSTQKLVQGLAALDPAARNGGTSGAVQLRGPLLDAWRADHKWYERPEKRP